MTLHTIENALLDVFFEQTRRDAAAISAVNIVLHRVLTSPRFAGLYDNHALREEGPGLIWLSYQHRNEWVNVDPLRHSYIGYFDEDDVGVPLPPTHKDGARGEFEVEATTRALVEQYWQELGRKVDLDALKGAPEIDKPISIEVMGPEQLHDFLTQLLGPGYEGSLKRHGMDYHHVPCNWADRKLWEYAVAHTEQGLAGISAWTIDQGEMGLSYVCVAPGFRQKGVSLKLYQTLIDRSLEEGCTIARSSPGTFAAERPGITHAYDRLLLASSALHVLSGSYGYLQKAVQDLREGRSVAQWQALCKPFCDQALIQVRQSEQDPERPYGFVDMLDRQLAQQLREAGQARPSPRPR